MAKRPLVQNGAGNKQEGPQHRAECALGEKAAKQCAETALQRKTKQGEPSEILEGTTQQTGQWLAEQRYQRDGIGIRNTDALGRIDGRGNTQGEGKGTLPIEQPTCIVLLDILFHIAAAAESIVCNIQRYKSVDQ